MSKFKLIISGVFWSGLAKVFDIFLKFISVPLLLNHYGKAQYALIALAMSINVYLRLMDMGFNTGNIKFFSSWTVGKQLGKVNRLFQTSLFLYGIIGVFNCIILLVLRYYSQGLFSLSSDQDEILKTLLTILSISAIVNWITSVFNQYLRAIDQIAFEERVNAITNILVFLPVVLSIYFDLTITVYFFLNILMTVILIPVKIFKVFLSSKGIDFYPRFDKPIFKEIIGYNMSIFAMGVFQFSAIYLRPVILGIKSTDITVNTDYRILQQITTSVTIISTIFLGVVLPIAAKAVQEGDLKMQQKLSLVLTKYLSIILAAVVFIFMLCSKQLLTIYVGQEYAHLSFWLNIWLLALLGHHNAVNSALILSGSNLKPYTYFSIFSATSSLILAWYLIPFFAMGGVIATYFYYVVLQISFFYNYYIPRKLLLGSWDSFYKSFLKPTIYAAGVMGIVKGLLYVLPHLQDIYYIILSTVLYLLIFIPVVIFLILQKDERKYVHAKISNILR